MLRAEAEAETGQPESKGWRCPTRSDALDTLLDSGLDAGEVDEAALHVGANQFDAQLVSDIGSLLTLRQ